MSGEFDDFTVCPACFSHCKQVVVCCVAARADDRLREGQASVELGVGGMSEAGVRKRTGVESECSSGGGVSCEAVRAAILVCDCDVQLFCEFAGEATFSEFVFER